MSTHAHVAPRRSTMQMRTRTRALNLPDFSVPDRIVPILSFVAAGLVIVYVVLVVTTIFFASWQTQLASSIDSSHDTIGQLEDQYYAAIARIDGTDPSSLGLVAPKKVEYVVATQMPGLTFAGR